ncbi:VOC family protein [Fretibacter rubidus]|uniref:VOC family protein n=1 Tax=Fretibacter rubidus TaxID=570162 RepID=UPI003529F3BD
MKAILKFGATTFFAVLLSSCGANAPDKDAANDTTTSIAAPDAAMQKFPTDLRRTSLIVSSIDESLKLYRDVLGFQVNYDTEVTMSGKSLPAGEPGAKARLVLLSTNDSWVGWIGMLEWLDPKLETPSEPRRRLGIGDAVLVFNTENVDEHCAAAAKLEGIHMTNPGSETTYPGRNGAPPIVVRTCYLFDRDGYFMELNKILDRESYQ